MRRVLVTGANRGIGLEFVRQMAARGDRIFATCRNPDGAKKLRKLAAQHPEQITVVALDVIDQASIEESHRAVTQHTGGLDWLVNNAGIYPRGESIGKLNVEKMLNAFHLNTVAPAMIAQQYLDLLRAGTEPKIVNVSTRLGSITLKQSGRDYSYCSSKAALNMLTRALSFDVKRDGIIAVVVHPGWVKTDMGGQSASLTPEQSVAGLLRVIDGLTMADNGGFFQWDGQTLPW